MPYENMKLRMLNGGHSSLAYIASLLFMKESDQSKVTVDRVMRDKDVEQFVVQYMNEGKESNVLFWNLSKLYYFLFNF